MQVRIVAFFLLILMVLALVSPTSELKASQVEVETGRPVAQVDAQCIQVVNTALSSLGTVCAGLDDNQACYGFNTIEVTFDGEVPGTDFLEPSDRVPLTPVSNFIGSEIDPVEDEIGVALIDVIANLPASLSDKTGRMVLIGAVEIENDVEPDTALLPLETPLDVSTANTADLHEQASATSPTVGSVPSGTALEIDGISADSEWLRVYYEYVAWQEYTRRATAWINVADVETGVPLDTLPVIEPDSLTPYQKFYLITEPSNATCRDEVPPPLLYIQGPHQIEFRLNINDAEIWMSSSGLLRLSSPTTMEVAALTGVIRIFPETADEIIVPAGYHSFLCLSELQDLGIDGIADDRQVILPCPGMTPTPLSGADLARYNPLEQLPENVLLEPAFVPSIVEFSTVGGFVTEYRFDNPEDTLAAVRALCDLGILPQNVCDTLLP